MSGLTKRATKYTATAILLMIWAGPLLEAQGNSQAARVRSLNNDLLRIHGLLQRATPNEMATLRSQAAPVIEQRAAALSALIEVDAKEAFSLAFSPDLLADLAAVFPQSAARLESHGAWQGPIEYLISDDPTMTVHRSLRRMRVGQEQLEIHFTGAEPAGLKSGDLLSARGVRAGNRVAAADGNILGSTLVEAACSTIGAQNIVAILVNFKDYALTSGVDQELVKGIFYGNAYTSKDNTPDWSVDGFWQENSDGRTSAPYAGGKVVGPYTLSGNYNTNATGQPYCDSDGVLSAAIAAADADVNFQNYSRLMVVMPPNGACGWAGLGSLGCWTESSPGDGTFTSSVVWQRSDQMANRSTGVRLSTHELGHNLTMHHASWRDFPGPPREPLGPLGASGTLNEYGDLFSTMGSWNFGFYSAHHMEQQLGWFQLNTNYRVVESNGAYSIQAYETRPAGLKALKIRRGTGNDAWLWVEYRQNLGIYDSQLGSQVFSGALIHYEDSSTGTRTHLPDFTPATTSFSDPALAVGQSWQDPYSNVRLSIDSAAGGMLNVSVTYGTVPCTHANPTVTLSPANQSVQAGSSVNYTVSVTNNDSLGCSSSTFNLTSALPTGWPTSFASSSLTIAPGQTGSTTMTKTAGPSPGTYPVDAKAANGLYSGTGNANCTVTAPPPLTVTVSVNKPTYAPRSIVSTTATVKSGSNPAPGASVRFMLTKPGSSTTTKTVTTGSNGLAAWNYRLGPKDPPGLYSVNATATLSSQTVTSNTVNFAVQ